MRLIDVDALIADLEHDVAIDQDMLDYEELSEINRGLIQYDKDCKQSAIDLLKHTPTIEPERKKGKWISLDDFRGKYNAYGYKCSECCEHSEYEENYCPNCGADMRGDGNETD